MMRSVGKCVGPDSFISSNQMVDMVTFICIQPYRATNALLTHQPSETFAPSILHNSIPTPWIPLSTFPKIVEIIPRSSQAFLQVCEPLRIQAEFRVNC
jgi:hypothetical protein